MFPKWLRRGDEAKIHQPVVGQTPAILPVGDAKIHQPIVGQTPNVLGEREWHKCRVPGSTRMSETELTLLKAKLYLCHLAGEYGKRGLQRHLETFDQIAAMSEAQFVLFASRISFDIPIELRKIR